jgi:hypothetical protein
VGVEAVVKVDINTQKRNGEKEMEEKERRQERIARAGNKNILSFFFRRQK